MTNAIVDVALQAIHKIADGFTNPNDDWIPTLLFRADGKGYIVPLIMTDEGDKEILPAFITMTLHEANATEAVLVISAWNVVRESLDDLEDKPSRCADRAEVLVMTHVSRDETSIKLFPILRDGVTPPTLGEVTHSSAGIDVVGRFADALRVGIG